MYWSSAITSMPPCASRSSPCVAAGGVHDLEAEPRQAAVDQPGQRRVVVDIQQRGRRVDVMWRLAGPE